ncbi:hypothetical protein DFR50_108130 [Roseiarcus fermentans]|uniref:Uncharacterized protein n=1 Tax=Roseiarcus fermentans TaxID=1473586 RepID=A0A366FLJ4_9HYPH|nr:hypothetical protein DFR50_108130 [Roseiarcus fermentans]
MPRALMRTTPAGLRSLSRIAKIIRPDPLNARTHRDLGVT